MIRLLLNPRQTLDDVAPDLPERVPVQPGDIVVQKHDGAYRVFRHDPGAKETGVLVFTTFEAAIHAAQEADREPTPLQPRAYAAALPRLRDPLAEQRRQLEYAKRLKRLGYALMSRVGGAFLEFSIAREDTMESEYYVGPGDAPDPAARDDIDRGTLDGIERIVRELEERARAEAQAAKAESARKRSAGVVDLGMYRDRRPPR